MSIPGKPSRQAAIDLRPWTWGINLDAAIGAAVTSVIETVFAEDPPGLSLAWQYSRTGDPLAITIELPLGPTDSDTAEWSVSFTSLIEEMLDYYRAGGSGMIPPDDHRAVFAPVAAALRELADTIDAAGDTSTAIAASGPA